MVHNAGAWQGLQNIGTHIFFKKGYHTQPSQLVYATRISYPDCCQEFERAVLSFVYGFFR